MGFIITLSGLDGVGKTTQCNNIKDYFVRNFLMDGIDIADICNNTYEDYNDLMKLFNKVKKYNVIVTRFYLSTKKSKQLSYKLLYETHFDDSSTIIDVVKDVEFNVRMYYKYVINPLIKMGDKILIFDRFFYDEIAYRSLYGISMNMIGEIYQDWYPKSDLSFLLSLPIYIIEKRNKYRDDSCYETRNFSVTRTYFSPVIKEKEKGICIP